MSYHINFLRNSPGIVELCCDASQWMSNMAWYCKVINYGYTREPIWIWYLFADGHVRPRLIKLHENWNDIHSVVHDTGDNYFITINKILFRCDFDLVILTTSKICSAHILFAARQWAFSLVRKHKDLPSGQLNMVQTRLWHEKVFTSIFMWYLIVHHAWTPGAV